MAADIEEMDALIAQAMAYVRGEDAASVRSLSLTRPARGRISPRRARL